MQKYLKIFTLSLMHALRNKKALLGLSIFLLVCLVIFSQLWKVIEAKGFNSTELLWYIALNEWVLIALPSAERSIEDDLRSGRLATVLPRPISYLASQFFESVGELCANLLVLGIVSFGFTWLMVGGLEGMGSLLPIWMGVGLLAGVVGTLFQMLVGFTAFWIYEVDPIHWIWEKLLFAFGGLILPLSVYPDWWQSVARYTPFPYILGYRSALAVDEGSVLSVIFGLVLFGLAAFGALCFVYRKGLKILNAEGG